MQTATTSLTAEEGNFKVLLELRNKLSAGPVYVRRIRSDIGS